MSDTIQSIDAKKDLYGLGAGAASYLGALPQHDIQMFGTEPTEADKRRVNNGYNQVSIHTQIT